MRKLICSAVAAMVAASPAAAVDFSFTGNFRADDNVQLFNFVVGAPSAVTLRTWSYAGGVNAAGQNIAQGGFDPILALFDSSGTLIGQNDDGGSSLVAIDAETGFAWDTFLTANLNPGTYFVTVMQFDNFAVGPNFVNGFTRQGTGNFTAARNCPDAQPSFQDVSGVAGCGRSNAWAFDILNVERAAIPEPASWALMIAGFGLAGAASRRARRTNVVFA